MQFQFGAAGLGIDREAMAKLSVSTEFVRSKTKKTYREGREKILNDRRLVP